MIEINKTGEKLGINDSKYSYEKIKLDNVKYGLYDEENNLITEVTTDENGIIEVELEYGSYYYKEISTLENYILNNDKNYFEVKKDGEIINSTLVNVKEEVEVPNTNLNKNYSKYIISFSLGLVGIGLLIYEKKKRK